MALGLFKKKKKKGSDTGNLKLTIKEVIRVADDAVNLVFEKPGVQFSYLPGQFITLSDNISGKKIFRPYSFCSSPYVDEFPTVTVKRVPGGLMSNHINDNYHAGQEVEAQEPMGLFTTEYNSDRSRHAIFFGGGSGITPLFSILKTILQKEPDSKVSLIYGNRREEFIIFREELDQMNEAYPNFELKHILEEPGNADPDFTGRPTPDMIAHIYDSLDANDQTEIYVCGPEGMMDTVADGLQLAGVKDHQIKRESFEAGKTSPAEVTGEVAAGEMKSEVIIVLDGETHNLTLDKSRPILEQALKKDLDMPYSCQSGLCTACMGRCIEGEVSVDEAEGLIEEEIAEGYVLTCVGKPVSDKIKIEIG